MRTLTKRNGLPELNGVPPLMNGDRLKQPEFHRRYEAYPEDSTFELVGGIVYMASPLRVDHSDYDGKVGLVLELYQMATPGVGALHNATTILDEDSEPQPDGGLYILPEFGGQARINEDRYIEGAPEFLAEIAHSSVALDLHAKRDDYERTGVREYLVVCVEEQEVRWFDLRGGGMIRADRQGVLKSRVFPGLWIHEQALLALDGPRLVEVVQQGLASRAHAAFVKRIRANRRSQP
jgi:hypothetical protein